MGLTIHYSGSFNPVASLPCMIREVKEVAEVNNWEYFVFEEKFPVPFCTDCQEELYGICFTPPGCDMVSLTFLSNARMCGPAQLRFFGCRSGKEEENLLYNIFTKTQYAGIEVHKKIIKILKYISKKYLSDFAIYDEGQYWETGDEELLQQIFGRYNLAMDILSSALCDDTKSEDESVEEQLKQLFPGVEIKQVRLDE